MHYASFIHEHKRTASSLIPQKRLTRQTAVLCSLFLVVTSVAPAGGFFDGTYYDDSNYLSEQDIAFNLEQLQNVVTNEDGNLVKTVPQNEESEIEARIETVNHTVQPNETLDEIADLYELKVDTITHENSIVNLNDVRPGQVLKIPPVDGLSHTVGEGENVSSIAAKYSVSTGDIMEINGLDSSFLKVGQVVFVPGGEISSILVADNTTDTPDSTETPNTSVTEVTENNDTPEVVETLETVDSNFTPIDELNSTTNIVSDPDPEVNVPVVADKPLVTENPEVEATVAPLAEGTWGMPTIGQVTQGYHRGHYAIDLADQSKPPIWAAADGVVVTAQGGWNGGYGNYIIIDHGNGYKTLYAHNEEIYVTVGESVAKGQAIGKMGNSGRVYGVTGIHLHYECRLNGEKINPYNCMP
jgi:murein DD-endopeptidase MepM/ murein hydrolase activator NlpD